MPFTRELSGTSSRISELHLQLQLQETRHTEEMAKLRKELDELQRLVKELNVDPAAGRSPNEADQYTMRVEWTIPNFSSQEREKVKGDSLWSPKFRAAGMEDLQLEFLPNGRDKSFPGFCSLFVWCPSGTTVRYQLWVGSYLRAPDEDEYTGTMGHGHSNFCPLAPEVDRENDSIRVGVDFLEVVRKTEISADGSQLQLWSRPLEALVEKEAQVLRNKAVSKVVWKIKQISRLKDHYPRGISMWSRLFTAGGLREMLLEFYPNGSTNTTKEGWCAFYIRCPEGSSINVTLFVGRVKKGPIKTTFESLAGKGLPDFCFLQDEIDLTTDCVEVGLEFTNNASTSLTLES